MLIPETCRGTRKRVGQLFQITSFRAIPSYANADRTLGLLCHVRREDRQEEPRVHSCYVRLPMD